MSGPKVSRVAPSSFGPHELELIWTRSAFRADIWWLIAWASWASENAAPRSRMPTRPALGAEPVTPRELLPRAAATPAQEFPCPSPLEGTGDGSLSLSFRSISISVRELALRSGWATWMPSSVMAMLTPVPVAESHAVSTLMSAPATAEATCAPVFFRCHWVL
jgi:hypothetical protein